MLVPRAGSLLLRLTVRVTLTVQQVSESPSWLSVVQYCQYKNRGVKYKHNPRSVVIDNDSYRPQRQSNEMTGTPFLQQTKLKWKDPDGGPVSEWGLPTEHAICSTTLNFNSTKHNDFLRVTFSFLFFFLYPPPAYVSCWLWRCSPDASPSPPTVSLLNLSLGLTALFPLCHNLSPRHQTCIINLSHSPHISNSIAHCTYPAAYCQQKPY